MPRLLSEENKCNRVVDSEVSLALCLRNPDEFLSRYITVDETWIHHYTPETKKQSKQSVFKGVDGEIGRNYLLHRLLWKRTNDNWSALCVVIAPVERRNQEKTSSFEKDSLPSRQ